jgi:hypothetical protein
MANWSTSCEGAKHRESPSAIPPSGGITQAERISLTIIFLSLVYVFCFFATSRVGFVQSRQSIACAVAAAMALAFWRHVLPPRDISKTQNRGTLFASLLVIGGASVVLFVSTAPGYVLAGHDPIIVPTLADALLSHATTMDVYRPGDPGFAYPPGYPILFTPISSLVTPLHGLFVFKIWTIILILLLPIGWAWLAYRIFRVPLPVWLIILLSYISVFGLERTVTLTLESGKNSQVLAGAVFPFLAGILMIATRTNIGIPVAIAALAGAILLHYSVFYMAVTFLAAYFLVYFPRERSDWRAALRLAFAGIVALGIAILLLRAAFDDPRIGSFGWSNAGDGLERMAETLFAKYDDLLFVFNGPAFPFWLHWPYRGPFLIGCIVLSLAIGHSQRGAEERAFAPARMAGVFGIMWLTGIAFGSGVVNVGITPEFTRWYLIFPQAALMLSTLCAVAGYALSKQRGAKVAYCGLAGVAVLGTLVAGVDFVHIARVYRAQRIALTDLTNVRDVLSNEAPCFLVTQSRTVADGLHTMQMYKPLDYAELLTGCKILNGSFVQRAIPDGRALEGLPAPAALATLPPAANVFLIVPETIETAYHEALPGFELLRQSKQIGPLPVWRIRLGPDSK